MSINNPYKKRLIYDKVVITPDEELTITRIREEGKWKMVDDFTMGIESCWNDAGTREVLLRLFNGTTKFNDLNVVYKEAIEQDEMKKASKEGRHPTNPFPFFEYKPRFIQAMTELKALGLVDQSGGEVMTSDDTSFTITETGVNLVMIKLSKMINREKFDAFMVLLSKKGQKIPLSYIVMKMIEQRNTPFDQLVALIDDLERVNASMLVLEYKRYLVQVEDEDLEEIDDSAIEGSIKKKIASLVSSGLVNIDRSDGAFHLTRKGDIITETFWERVKSLFYFLRRTGMIAMQKDGNNRLFIWITEEGASLGKAIKKMHEEDEDRIIEMRDVLDDMDDHETSAVLPVDQYVKKIKDTRKNIMLSLYLVPRTNMNFFQRIRKNSPAISGAAVCFSVLLMVFGLFIVGSGMEYEGFFIIAISLPAIAVFVLLYSYTMKKTKMGNRKGENEIIQDLYLRRIKKKKKQKNKKKWMNAQRRFSILCCLVTISIVLVVVLSSLFFS